MAEKRMFTQKIIDSDAFLEMPLSAQALYFHLNMRADDDGFVNNPKKITRYVNASEDDLRILLLKRFVIGFDSGVIVIKHWRMHNTIKSDRYHPTDYTEEFSMLGIKPNKAYTDKPASLGFLPSTQEPDLDQYGTEVEPERNQNGAKTEPEIRLDKIRLGLDKNRKEDISISDEIDCSTDVQRVMDAWNAIGLQKIVRLDPESKRGQMLQKRIKDYGVDQIVAAIESIPDSSFLMGKKKDFKATFDWFIKPNNFPKVLEGNYLDSPKKVYGKDDLAYKAAAWLGRKIRKRTDLPEPDEDTLQKWAAELEACAEENETNLDDMADVLSFSQEDKFWCGTIIDAFSVRKHYRRLMAAMAGGERS